MSPFNLSGGPREEEQCIRCLQLKDATDVDRRHWCRECRAAARERAKAEGWKAGAVFAGVLALWIWIFIRPSTLILGAWIATVVAAFWLVSKIAREVHYGVARYRNEAAVEAKPPVASSEGEGSGDNGGRRGGNGENAGTGGNEKESGNPWDSGGDDWQDGESEESPPWASGR